MSDPDDSMGMVKPAIRRRTGHPVARLILAEEI
jgi:hypothetical protein